MVFGVILSLSAPLPPCPLCEEIKATVQKHRQSLGHSKEDLNKLNQAIQRLTVDVEVDGAKTQVRYASEGGRGVMAGGPDLSQLF